MSFEQFLDYIKQINEIRGIEAGVKLTNREKTDKQFALMEKAMKRKKRNMIE